MLARKVHSGKSLNEGSPVSKWYKDGRMMRAGEGW